MRTITLAQILSPAQLKEVDRILKGAPDNLTKVQRLKDYYGTFREDLERQDILPEYLAYATVFTEEQLQQLRRTASRGRRRKPKSGNKKGNT